MKRFQLLLLLVSWCSVNTLAGTQCESSDIKLEQVGQTKYYSCICGDKKIYMEANGVDKNFMTSQCSKGLSEQIYKKDESYLFVSSNPQQKIRSSDHLTFQKLKAENIKKEQQKLMDQYGDSLYQYDDDLKKKYDKEDKNRQKYSQRADKFESEIQNFNELKNIGVVYQDGTDEYGNPIYKIDEDMAKAIEANKDDTKYSGLKKSDIKSLRNDIEKYNKNVAESNVHAKSMNELQTQGNEQVTKSFEEAMTEANGDVKEAFNLCYADTYKKNKEKCLEFRASIKDPKLKPDEKGFPKDGVSLPEEHNLKTCEDWANYQTEHDESLNEVKQAYAFEREKQDSTPDLDGNPGTDSENMKKHIAGKLQESGFDYKWCEQKIYTDTTLQRMGQDGGALEGATVNKTTIKNAANRRIYKPGQCSNRNEPIFDLKGNAVFTNAGADPLQHLTDQGKGNICFGMAYTNSDGVVNSCNDYFVLSSQCAEKVEESSLEITDFDQIDLNMLEQIKFKDVKNCSTFFQNKFKQCMGFPYKKITANNEGQLNEPVNDTPASDAVKKKIQETLVSEINNQWGTCFAYRSLSLEQNEKVGAWEGAEEIRSLDGRYLCRRVTPWTQDFKACKGLVNAYNSFLVGDQGRQVAGQIWSGVEQSNIRENAIEQMNSDGANQVNVGLEAQKETYKHMRDKENVNLAFFTAQSGVLATMLAVYPTPRSFSRKCGENEVDAHCIVSYDLAELSTEDPEDYRAINSQLFPNQQIKSQMWGKVMESAAGAALAAMKAAEFKRRIGDVQKFKDAYNNMNTDVAQTESTLEVGYCSLNPMAPGCKETGPRVMGNSAFQYGNMGTQNGDGQAFSFNQDNGSFGEIDEEDLTAQQKNAIDDLSNIIDQDSAASFDNDYKKVGAGSFSLSHNNGSGGGGGGGAGGGGGGGGGGGSPAGAAKGNDSGFGNIDNKTSYKSAMGGKTNFKSANGLSDRKKSDNPFSNLFGKKSGRGVASQVENDIAPSHSGLFDKISKRYNRIQTDNRLHQFK